MKFRSTLYSLTLFGAFTLLCIAPFAQHPAHDKQLLTPERKCIESVLNVDDSIGKIRNNASEHSSLSLAIQQYIEGIDKLDFRECPPGFSKAFAAHKEAWRGMINVTNKYPGIRGEMHTLFKQLEAGPHAHDFKIHLKAIWDTWAEVETFVKPLQ